MRAKNLIADMKVDAGGSEIFRWIMDEVLPVTSTYDLGEKWWKTWLTAMVRGREKDIFLINVLKHCNIQTAQSAFICFVNDLRWNQQPSDVARWKFNLLAEKCGSVSFLQELWGKVDSPLSKSLERSAAFAAFRTLLEASGYGFAEIVRREVKLHDNGWKEGNLLAFLKDRSEFVLAEDPIVKCKHCPWDTCGPVRG